MKIDFKVVDRACKEFPLVSRVFNETIAELYGPQEDALDKIGAGGDRLCEMLFVDNTPLGIIIYKKDLQHDNSLELKTLCLLDHHEKSGKGYGSILLERVHDVAQRRRAEQILVTVSSNSPSLGFFENKGFKINERCPDKYVTGHTENILSCPVAKHNELKNTTLANSAINSVRAPVLFQAPRTRRQPDLTCTLKKQYIDAILSGKKFYEGRVATKYFDAYTKGKTVRWESYQNSVTTEIVSRHEFESFGEMLNKLGYEKFVPEARSLDEAKRLYDSIPGYKEKVRRFGAIALELKVVETKNEQRLTSLNNHSQRENHSDTSKEFGRKRGYQNSHDSYHMPPSKRRRP